MADPIPPWPGQLVSLSIGDVFVRATPVLPDAESAVLVHGLGGSSRNWTDLMDLLSRPDARSGAAALAVQALDLPGFGYSPLPADGDYSIDARAAAVIALIDERGSWPVHLVGNSLGGAICTRVAARRPDLVRTLTLISPALPDLRPRLLSLQVAAMVVPGLGRRALARLESQPPENRAAGTLRQVFADPALMHPDRIREEVAEVTRRDSLGYQMDVLLGTTKALVAEYVRRGPTALWRDAARVTAPTLVIHGSHDRLVNPAMAARAARTFRSGQAVVLPRVGHVAMMERPDLVARIMREFLSSADSTRPGPDRTAGQLNQVPH